MIVTLLGIVTLVRPWHFLNALQLTTDTPSGIIILVRLVQRQNASVPISVTPSGITTSPPEPTYFFKTPFSIMKSLALLKLLSSFLCCFSNLPRIYYFCSSYLRNCAVGLYPMRKKTAHITPLQTGYCSPLHTALHRTQRVHGW